MISQRHCPYCGAAAIDSCQHLAVAIEGRNFVPRCVELSQAKKQWDALCAYRRKHQHGGASCSDQEDFTWLETAFCNEFLRRLRWFGGMEHEWRSGSKPEQGGFFVIVWSRNPQRLWWELRDEFTRQMDEFSRSVRTPVTTPQVWAAAPLVVPQTSLGLGFDAPI